MDFAAVDIDPIEAGFGGVPDGRFAEQGAGVEEQFDHMLRLSAASRSCPAAANLFAASRLISFGHPGLDRRLSRFHPQFPHCESSEEIPSCVNPSGLLRCARHYGIAS